MRLLYSAHHFFNPLKAELFNLNFQSLEVVCRYRDTQLQVTKFFYNLWNSSPTVYKCYKIKGIFHFKQLVIILIIQVIINTHNVYCSWRQCSKRSDGYYNAIQRWTAVAAHLKSKELVLFAFFIVYPHWMVNTLFTSCCYCINDLMTLSWPSHRPTSVCNIEIKLFFQLTLFCSRPYQHTGKLRL